MYIAYSSSDLYSELAATSMASVLVNNRSVEDITFLVIEKGITDEHKKGIATMVESYNRKVVFFVYRDVENPLPHNSQNLLFIGSVPHRSITVIVLVNVFDILP